MGKILRFFRLSRAERSIFLGAVLLLALARLGLALLSFRKLLLVLGKLMRIRLVRSCFKNVTQAQVIWAVETAGRYIPMCACLPQALTAQVLLHYKGQKTSLRIGVVKDQEGKLESHAWLENNGRVLFGALQDLSRYACLPELRVQSGFHSRRRNSLMSL